MSSVNGSKMFSRVVLAERPTESITPSTFREESVPFNFSIGDSQALVNVLYASVDPAMRGWISTARSYMRPVEIGVRPCFCASVNMGFAGPFPVCVPWIQFAPVIV